MAKLNQIKARLKKLHKLDYKGVQGRVKFWQNQLDQAQSLRQQGVITSAQIHLEKEVVKQWRY